MQNYLYIIYYLIILVKKLRFLSQINQYKEQKDFKHNLIVTNLKFISYFQYLITYLNYNLL